MGKTKHKSNQPQQSTLKTRHPEQLCGFFERKPSAGKTSPRTLAKRSGEDSLDGMQVPH